MLWALVGLGLLGIMSGDGNNQTSQAYLKSKNDCFFANDKITIDFSIGTMDNQTLAEKYPKLDLNKQQFYMYKPSEIFVKSVDSMVMDHSSARNNLNCSYDLFDECNALDGADCFYPSDSFACKYDAKKMQDALVKSEDGIPSSFHSSRLLLNYTTDDKDSKGYFHLEFDVTESPGTYCVNIMTYPNFYNPLIRFKDNTPISKKHTNMPSPVYDYLCWLGIATVSLVVFGLHSLLYNQSTFTTLVIGSCLLNNAFDTIAIFMKVDKVIEEAYVIVVGVCGTFLMIIVLLIIGIFAEERDRSLLIFSPYIFTKVYHFIVMSIQRAHRPYGYFVIGTIMNNQVFYKYHDQVLFYVTLAINIICWISSICVAFNISAEIGRKKAAYFVFLGTLYFIICMVIEVSFISRKSHFLDVFYKDPLVIIYSRLDEFLIMSFICGRTIWKLFQKHHQFYTSEFASCGNRDV